MFVKLNLFVICAVILNFGECNNCGDVLKCVTNWVGDALSPNSNVTLNYIDDTLVNVSTSEKSPDSNDNLLTNLSRFLVDKFSSLIKEGPPLKKIYEKTKIYVQTFQINENLSESKPINNASNPHVLENYNNDTNILNNTHKIQQVNNFTNKENKFSYSYIYDGDNQKTNNNYNVAVTIQPMLEITITESDMITKHSNSTKKYDDTNNTKFEYTTNNLFYTSTEQETVTTPDYSNSDELLVTKENIEITTVKFFDVPFSLTTVTEKNNDIHSPDETNRIRTEVPNQKINIKENYIDATNDFIYSNNEIDITELVHENLTDYLDIDYVDMYKDTTNEDVDYIPAVYTPTTTPATRIVLDENPTDGVDSVYSWIATIFVMNPDGKQFEYICDGSLLSEHIILTAARCVIKANQTVDTNNILVILGKRSLQSTGQNEKVLRVKSIKIHDKFVPIEGKVDNDLAIVLLAEPVMFNGDIQPAPLGIEDKSTPLAVATTGWHVSGPLQPLYLGLQYTENCKMESDNRFCATLGDSETTCPSYGGLFIERHDNNQWRLKGIASGVPVSTGVCFNKNLTFTKIESYLDWIKKSIQEETSY